MLVEFKLLAIAVERDGISMLVGKKEMTNEILIGPFFINPVDHIAMTNRNVNARLSYLAASVESSLHRNGKVFTHRDRDGNDDGGYHGVVTEQRDVVINDARRLDQSWRRQLEVHGFELLHRPL